MTLSDAECIFHLPLSNHVSCVDDDDVLIGVQSREHNMNTALALNIGTEAKEKIISAFKDLALVLENKIKNGKVQDNSVGAQD